MSELSHPNSPQQNLLASVPNVAEIRINAMLATLTRQRDSANSTAANLSAELEVYKNATDFYQQQSLGYQAQLALTRAEHAQALQEVERLQSEAENSGSSVESFLAKEAKLSQVLTDFIALSQSCKSIKELKIYTSGLKSAFDQVLDSALVEEANSDNAGTF